MARRLEVVAWEMAHGQMTGSGVVDKICNDGQLAQNVEALSSFEQDKHEDKPALRTERQVTMELARL